MALLFVVGVGAHDDPFAKQHLICAKAVIGYIVVGTGVLDCPLQTDRANKICLFIRTVGDAGPYIFVSFVQHTPCRLR